jgi:hypothetical protein
MIGVYVAAGPNPIFLRMFFLQMARQTVLPDIISIFENGNKTSAMDWVCKDIMEELSTKGIQIIHKHDPQVASYLSRYYEPLRMIYHKPVEAILKMDLDDFYEDRYIENTVNMLGDNDLAINQNCGLVLVRPFHGDFKHRSSAVMVHSPMGAAPTHVSFNRKFAEKYLGFLAGAIEQNREDVADDELMAECMQSCKVSRVDGPVDYMYVSHGNNQSSAGWQSTGGKIYFDK